MSPRPFAYFAAAFFPVFASAAGTAHTASGWITAVSLAAAAGAAALVAYFDHTNTPPPPPIPA